MKNHKSKASSNKRNGKSKLSSSIKNNTGDSTPIQHQNMDGRATTNNAVVSQGTTAQATTAQKKLSILERRLGPEPEPETDMELPDRLEEPVAKIDVRYFNCFQ